MNWGGSQSKGICRSHVAQSDPVLASCHGHFGITAGQPHGFSLCRLSRPCCHTQLQRRVQFWEKPRASWPRGEGWDWCEHPASELQHVLRGRLTSRLEISSMGDWLGWGRTTSSLVFDREGFSGFVVFFNLVTRACLGPTMTLGADFCGLSLLTGVCSFTPCSSFSDRAGSGVGIGWGSSPDNRLPPTDDVVTTGPRPFCSADGSTQFTFGAAEGLGGPPTLLRSTGVLSATAALASFQLTQPWWLAVWFPPQLQHLSYCCEVEHFPERWVSPQATHRGALIAVLLHMADTLAAFALQRAFWGDVHLYQDLQTEVSPLLVPTLPIQ